MSDRNQLEYDYKAGLQLITKWLISARDGYHSPTPEVRRLQSLIKEIDALVDRLSNPEWYSLESVHDADPPPEFGLNGRLFHPGASNQGRYAAAIQQLREIAYTARQQIEELPDPRQRTEVPQAAQLLLHLRYRSGFPPPTVYESGDFVIDFDEICKAAGISLSPQRLTNILSESLRKFDRFMPPTELKEILVIKDPPNLNSAA